MQPFRPGNRTTADIGSQPEPETTGNLLPHQENQSYRAAMPLRGTGQRISKKIFLLLTFHIDLNIILIAFKSM